MPSYDDRVEVTLAHKVAGIAHYWKYVDKKPNEISCICCQNKAVRVYYCPFGTNESINIIQPLCRQHEKDFGTFKNEMYIIEDFL